MHAVAGYAAVHFGKAHVDRGLLIKVFAGYTLLNALVNLITRRGFGEKVRCCSCRPTQRLPEHLCCTCKALGVPRLASVGMMAVCFAEPTLAPQEVSSVCSSARTHHCLLMAFGKALERIGMANTPMLPWQGRPCRTLR